MANIDGGLTATTKLRKSLSQVNPRWALGLGILTTIMGFAAIYLSVATTLISVFILGALILSAGIAQIIYLFSSHKWTEVVWHLVLAALYIFAGLSLMYNPVSAAVSLTLFLAAFFIVSGIFRIFAAATMRFRNWGWALMTGALSFVAGLVVMSLWPVGSLWTIGLLIGMEMVFVGSYFSTFALAHWETSGTRGQPLQTATNV